MNRRQLPDPCVVTVSNDSSPEPTVIRYASAAEARYQATRWLADGIAHCRRGNGTTWSKVTRFGLTWQSFGYESAGQVTVTERRGSRQTVNLELAAVRAIIDNEARSATDAAGGPLRSAATSP